MPTESEDGISASQIFDLYLSLNRRKEVVAKASAMLETYSDGASRPDYHSRICNRAQNAGLRFHRGLARQVRCFMSLGRDAVSGSATSPIRKTLPKTGVPYVERFAARDCRIGEADHQQGRPYPPLSRSRGRSATTPITGSAISAKGATPASARTCRIGCGAQSDRRACPAAVPLSPSRARCAASRIGCSSITPALWCGSMPDAPRLLQPTEPKGGVSRGWLRADLPGGCRLERFRRAFIGWSDERLLQDAVTGRSRLTVSRCSNSSWRSRRPVTVELDEDAVNRCAKCRRPRSSRGGCPKWHQPLLIGERRGSRP